MISRNQLRDYNDSILTGILNRVKKYSDFSEWAISYSINLKNGLIAINLRRFLTGLLKRPLIKPI